MSDTPTRHQDLFVPILQTRRQSVQQQLDMLADHSVVVVVVAAAAAVGGNLDSRLTMKCLAPAEETAWCDTEPLMSIHHVDMSRRHKSLAHCKLLWLIPVYHTRTAGSD